MSIFQLVLVDLFLCNVANIVFLCLTDGGYDAQFDQTPGRLLLRKQMKLKCYEQRIAVARTSLDQGVNAEFIRLNWNQVEFVL